MKRTARQLDAEIDSALARRKSGARKPRPEVVALFAYLEDLAEAGARENLFYARAEEGYVGDPKAFRQSEIWGRRLPDYKQTLLVDYIDEATSSPHERLGRRLTDKEASWMQREASRIRALEEKL